MKLLIFTLALVLSFAGFSEEYKTYSNSGLSVDYPPNWELNSSGMMGTKFILLSPQSNPDDSLRENVNYLTQDLTGYDMDIAGYVRLTLNQLSQMFPDIKYRTKAEKQTIDGREVVVLDYIALNNGMNLRMYQRVWLEENTAHILTYTAMPDQFDKYYGKVKVIMKSLKY